MFDQQLQFLESMMDVSTLKRTTIADNISNYSTPNYKSKKVVFDQMFQEGTQIGVKKTSDKHTSLLTNSKPMIVEGATTKERYDGNNVDLTNEMVDMIKNNYVHTTAVQATNKQFALYKLAMSTQG